MEGKRKGMKNCSTALGSPPHVRVRHALSPYACMDKTSYKILAMNSYECEGIRKLKPKEKKIKAKINGMGFVTLDLTSIEDVLESQREQERKEKSWVLGRRR